MESYFILNQGSFVKGKLTLSGVFVEKIIWYDESDDEEMRAHLSDDKGKTINSHCNGTWLVSSKNMFSFPNEEAALFWWNTVGKYWTSTFL